MADNACFSNTSRKPLMIALSLTLGMMFLEVIGGFVSGSLALISDAGHMLTDGAALFVCLLASIFAVYPATKEKTYGFYRLEILSALFNGSLLTIIALYVFYEAIQRMVQPADIRGGMMLVIAVIGLAVNIGVAFMLQKEGNNSLNVRGALLHVMSDAISSVGVIIGGIIILLTGWSIIDPVLSIMIGMLILRGAFSLLFDSVNILLESVPEGLNIEDIRAAIKQIDGIRDVHDIHVWSISSGNNAFSAHIKVDDIMISKSDKLIADINSILKDKFGIIHTTLQFECESCAEHEH